MNGVVSYESKIATTRKPEMSGFNRKGRVLQDNRSKPQINQTKPVVQRARSKQTGRKTKHPKYSDKWYKRRSDDYFAKPWRRYDDLRSKAFLAVLKGLHYTDDLIDRLEDDEDVADVKYWQRELEKLEHKTFQYRRAIRNKNFGRLRNQDNDQKVLIGKLTGIPFRVNAIVNHLKKLFPTSQGGFGAKGRAHQMNVSVNPQAVPQNSELDNSFVNSFQLNGSTLADNVYKTPAKVQSEKAKGAIVMGKTVDLNLNQEKREQELTQLEKYLFAVNTPQTLSFTKAPAKKGRGKGQYANMGNTNATGYAFLLGLQGWASQRWEWLHLRGAGLGGVTDSTNLMAGTRDANTHMIPFESNIRLLANEVETNDNYRELIVRWSATGSRAHHAFANMKIEWRLMPANNTAAPASGVAEFSPFQTGNNISKKEVTMIEDALKNAREDISK